jgi:hypothetical protein
MIQPRPAPKTPRPITDDPKVGQYQVVVSFRASEPRVGEDDVRWKFLHAIDDCFASFADLDVAVREIGAGGERSADEGRWDAPNRGSEHGP